MKRLLSLFALFLLSACASTSDIKSYSSVEETRSTTQEENRVWNKASEFDQMIRKMNLIYDDPELEAYLNQIMHKLYPELANAIRVKAIRASTLNAFTLANGSIYIHIGLLARMDNEAQLATVLAHEAVHFINKHNLKQTRNVKNSAAWGTALGITVFPLLGALASASNISGFSKRLEREADNEGYERLVASGYDAKQAEVVFQHLMDEVKALDIDEPYFFASHPKLKLRLLSFKKLNENRETEGELNTDSYLRVTETARIDSLREDLAKNRYKSVLVALNGEHNLSKYPEYIQFYLGEAYRLRNEEGDRKLAEQAYLLAVQGAPEFAPSYKSLGLLSMKKNEHGKSLGYFRMYLDLAPNAKDRAYVEQYIDLIETKRKGT